MMYLVNYGFKKAPHFHVISLFPESIQPYLETSILGRAQGLSGKKKRREAAVLYFILQPSRFLD
jgi:hypothetical protein